MRSSAFLVIAFVLLAASCSFQPAGKLPDIKNMAMTKGIAEFSQDEPDVTIVAIPKNSFEMRQLVAIPAEMDRDISIYLESPINDIIRYVSKLVNINIYSNMSSKTSADSVVTISYNGKLSGMFHSLGDVTGKFFVYDADKNSMIIKDEQFFNVVIPNYPDMLKTVESSLHSLGAKNVSFDTLSSSISFTIAYNSYDKIKNYFLLLQKNASLITVRAVLASVRLSDSHALGIDWSKMRTAVNSFSQPRGAGTPAAGTVSGYLLEYLQGQGGVSLLLDAKTFTLDAFLSFLQEHGSVKLMQNFFLGTLSGKEGKLEVLTEVPYVESISAVPLEGSSSSGNFQKTAKFDKAKSGVSLAVTPFYSQAAEQITINVDIGVFGVVKYVTLQAGDLGLITQPETTKKTIRTVLTLKTGQVAVIGGLLQEQAVSESKGLPVVDTLLTRRLDGSVQKEELVVIVKPVVTVFVREP